MAEVLTREELHALVWSTPMRTLAGRFGISDVALRKRCVKAQIPLPQAGYWAKRSAGKPVKQLNLSPRPPGMAHQIDVGGNRYSYRLWTDAELLGPIPEPPTFDESLDDIRRSYAAKIRKIVVPRDLAVAHQTIRKALAEDEARAEAQRGRSHVSIFDAPRFATAFEQRRLRLLNALALAVAKHGVRMEFRGRKLRAISATVHDTTLHLALDTEADLKNGHDEYRANDVPPNTPLKLVVLTSAGSRQADATWEDDKAGKLETQLASVAVELFVLAEARYRAHCAWRHQWRVECKERRLEEIRLAKEEAERAAQARLEQERQARIDRLLADAERFRQAQAIRGFVAEVVAQQASVGDSAISERWAPWALTIADSIDPLANGSLVASIADLPPPGDAHSLKKTRGGGLSSVSHLEPVC